MLARIQLESPITNNEFGIIYFAGQGSYDILGVGSFVVEFPWNKACEKLKVNQVVDIIINDGVHKQMGSVKVAKVDPVYLKMQDIEWYLSDHPDRCRVYLTVIQEQVAWKKEGF